MKTTSTMIRSDNSLFCLQRTCYLVSTDYRVSKGLIEDEYLKDIFD